LCIHSFNVIEKPHYQSDHEKTGDREDEKQQGFETKDVITQQSARPKQLANGADHYHTDQKPHAHAKSIPERGLQRILTGEHLQAHGDNGERYNEFYKDPHLTVCRREIRCQ